MPTLSLIHIFPVLLMTGGTLQRISLGAFIVAMGMLVDNAVVVLDGILVDLSLIHILNDMGCKVRFDATQS